MRIVLDTITEQLTDATAAIDCLKFGTLNGPGAWTTDQLTQARDAGQLLAVIDVLGDAPEHASIVDWTSMSPKDPGRLAWWVEQRNALHRDAVVMCVRDAMPNVLGIVGNQEYFRLLVTDLSTSGEPPLADPQYGLPPFALLLGCQYVVPPKSGGPYNLSILFDDTWHADQAGQGAAAALHATAAAAAPVLSPVEAQGADLAAAASPKHAASPAGPMSSPSLSAPPQDQLSTTAPDSPSNGAAAAAAFDAATTGAPDVSHETPGQLVRPFAASIGFAHLQAGDVEASTAAAFPAPGQPINHGHVWSWIQEGHRIAAQFSGANAPHVAAQLEESLGQLLEIGKLLSELGR